MKQIILFAVLLLTATSFTFGQTIRGQVIDHEKQPIVGALVRIADTSEGGFSNDSGEFTFETSHEFPVTIVTSIVGFKSDTLLVKEPKELLIQLQLNASLDAVVVNGRNMATDVDPLAAQHLEVLGEKELLKAACCNLSESFENSATVDVNFKDAVTGSKQITLLGLDGIYTQINGENMPLVRGLGEYFGLAYIPGTWIESIQVGKGAGSVINGYESMTGQINVEFHKPDNMDRFYLNGYQSVHGRTELNSHFSKHLNEKWSTALMLHGHVMSGEPDNNNDGFVDRNRGEMFTVFNRWKYVGTNNYRAQFGVKAVGDNKLGGQVGYEKDKTNNLYGISVDSRRYEVFAKNGLIFPEKPWKSVGLIVNGSFHQQDGIFGLHQLNSKQSSIYSNLIYQTMIGDTRHILKMGGNFQYDYLDEQLNQAASENTVSVPGIFAEYAYDNSENIKIVSGLRADYLEQSQSIEVSPRIHVKWTTDKENAIRLSLGRGFRMPNIYADYPALLVSARQIVLQEKPEIESSWNYGGSLTRYYKLNGREGTFSTDFYRTTFKNQIIRDMYTSANHIFISNLEGESYANSFQVSTDYELFDRFDLRIAYKRDDVKQEINGELMERQLTPKHRGMVNLAYALPFDRWKFDWTTQYVGEQRLPTTVNNQDGFSQLYSEDYITMNAQVTTSIKDWDIYVGGENLTNFQQSNPIIGADEPFQTGFDASSVWGPINRPNIYLGFRYKLKHAEH